jgi:hypothetical protein
MAWLIGIDEAGYGPNLGPLVMTSVACRLPDELVGRSLWRVLRNAVRRGQTDAGRRLMVADSKLVYTPARGLLDLETSVLAWLSGCPGGPALDAGDPLSVASLLGRVCLTGHEELCSEFWYVGGTPLPVEALLTELLAAADRFHGSSSDNGVHWGPVRSVIVCPARLNAALDQWGSKGYVLALALVELLRSNWEPDDSDEPVHFLVDKHGGRNYYSAVLQHALPDGMVLAREEGLNTSRYEVIGLKRPVWITIRPRADATSFCVALASMHSKYLREVLMLEFNRFWQERMPDLKPTAGYPGDSRRFYRAIKPVVAQLGIDEYRVWRRK